MRGRICALVQTDDTEPTQDSVFWGLVVANQDIAVTELPNPQLDVHVDWFAYCRNYAGAAGGISAGFEVDVRSMRKLEEMKQTVWLCSDFDAIGSAQFLYSVSLLLALP